MNSHSLPGFALSAVFISERSEFEFIGMTMLGQHSGMGAVRNR